MSLSPCSESTLTLVNFSCEPVGTKQWDLLFIQQPNVSWQYILTAFSDHSLLSYTNSMYCDILSLSLHVRLSGARLYIWILFIDIQIDADLYLNKSTHLTWLVCCHAPNWGSLDVSSHRDEDAHRADAWVQVLAWSYCGETYAHAIHFIGIAWWSIWFTWFTGHSPCGPSLHEDWCDEQPFTWFSITGHSSFGPCSWVNMDWRAGRANWRGMGVPSPGILLKELLLWMVLRFAANDCKHNFILEYMLELSSIALSDRKAMLRQTRVVGKMQVVDMKVHQWCFKSSEVKDAWIWI